MKFFPFFNDAQDLENIRCVFFSHINRGEWDSVLSLLKHDPSLANVLDKEGRTVWHYAARFLQTAVLEQLTSDEFFYAAEQCDQNINSPLHYAISHSEGGQALEAISARLIDVSSGRLLAVTNLDGLTALHLLARRSDLSLDLLKLFFIQYKKFKLLAFEADDLDANTPLHHAAESGNTQAFRFIFEKYSVRQRNLRNNSNLSAMELFIVARSEGNEFESESLSLLTSLQQSELKPFDYKLIKYFVEAWENIYNKENGSCEFLPLLWAASAGNRNLYDVLFQNVLELRISDPNNRHTHAELRRLLCGTEVFIGHEKFDALCLAIKKQRHIMVGHLLASYEFNVTANQEGELPLAVKLIKRPSDYFPEPRDSMVDSQIITFIKQYQSCNNNGALKPLSLYGVGMRKRYLTRNCGKFEKTKSVTLFPPRATGEGCSTVNDDASPETISVFSSKELSSY